MAKNVKTNYKTKKNGLGVEVTLKGNWDDALPVPKKLLLEKEQRREVTRLSSIANKRLKRLIEKDLHSSALAQWEKEGARFFGVKGKTAAQVRMELGRVKGFLNAATSTVTGAKENIQKLLNVAGYDKVSNVKKAQNILTNHYRLSSLIEQMVNKVESATEALGYRQIWTVVHQAVKQGKVDLSRANVDLEGVAKGIVANLEAAPHGWEPYMGTRFLKPKR